jgi:hypothetical protein
MARASTLALAASTTDGAFIPAQSGRRVRITSLWVQPGASTTVTLNSKPAGAGTAVSPAIAAVLVLARSVDGWLESGTSEGVSVTTSSGAASAVVASYTYVTP